MGVYQLKITLKSETTFGRGDGQAGVVDLEIQHDEMGCPFWSGRAIKGILVNECADILDALKFNAPWPEAAKTLFGRPGSATGDQGCLNIGAGLLPGDLRALLAWQLHQRQIKYHDGKDNTQKKESDNRQRERFRKQLLASVTTLRSQTAVDEDGSAKEHSLRTNRVLLPGLVFVAEIRTTQNLDSNEKAKGLLAACIKATHASGSGRNRGKGDVLLEILDHQGNSLTNNWFEFFKGGLS